MGQTIPCDLCNETVAAFLVTFKPNGDTIGLGLECVGVWAESITVAQAAEGLSGVGDDQEVFRVVMIATGDEMDLTIPDATEWAEAITRAMDAQRAAEAAGPNAEPITRPDRPQGRKRARRGRSGPVEVPADVADAEWEASGLEGRPPLSESATGTDGPGPGLEADASPAADDQG